MIELEKFKFYSLNLNGGEDTRVPAKIYCDLFGWTIRQESIGHSEVIISDEIVVVFSKPTANCPVEPGTITLVTDNFPSSLGEHFKMDLNLQPSGKYISFVDSWNNRIWFYQRK